MNRRYMDFVPSGVPAKKQIKVVRELPSTRQRVQRVTPVMERRVSSYGAVRNDNGVTVGFASEKTSMETYDDLNERFVKTDVPKRPLGAAGRSMPVGGGAVSQRLTVTSHGAPTSGRMVSRGITSEQATSPRLGAIEPVSYAEAAQRVDGVGNGGAQRVGARGGASPMYRMPRSPFINQEKVQKRPLSKNVYQKAEPAPAKEEPKGPVTIITKPEKQAHVSLIVAIILTIILGAAAGTIAFLLLPK